jgi:transposase-like protein
VIIGATNWEAVFALYDFPAKHRKHLRTINPIERLSLEQDRAGHDLQARTSRRKKVGIVFAVTISCRMSSSA